MDLIQNNLFDILIPFMSDLSKSADGECSVNMLLPHELKLDRNEIDKYFHCFGVDVHSEHYMLRRFRAIFKDESLFWYCVGKLTSKQNNDLNNHLFNYCGCH